MIDSLVFRMHLRRNTMLPTHFNHVAIDHNHKMHGIQSYIYLGCAIGYVKDHLVLQQQKNELHLN